MLTCARGCGENEVSAMEDPAGVDALHLDLTSHPTNLDGQGTCHSNKLEMPLCRGIVKSTVSTFASMQNLEKHRGDLFIQPPSMRPIAQGKAEGC
eukprot:749707-Hanusia_phi.AAC.4